MNFPRRFGRYLLIDKLATGGMAEIFEARLLGVEGFEKPLAIKQILPQWAERRHFIAMLIDEAKIVVRLNHPNIVQVYELGKEAGHYYLAMELVDGVDLRELQRLSYLKGKPIPLSVVCGIMAELARALEYAHALKDSEGRSVDLIHRDISPQNILVSYDGQVKVTDFGIAKATDSHHETITGTFKGKFAYMSPEQANQLALDQRSDLFSLGILFYELLTAERLFGGGSDLDTLDRVRQAQIPTERDSFRKIPQPLQALLLKLLSKEAAHRPAHATALLEDLKGVMTDLGLSHDPGELRRYMKALLGEPQDRKRHRRTLVDKQLVDFLEGETKSRDSIPDRVTVSMKVATGTTEPTQVFVREWPRRVARSRRWLVESPQRLLRWSLLAGTSLMIFVAIATATYLIGVDAGKEGAPIIAKESPKRRTPPEVVEAPQQDNRALEVKPLLTAAAAPDVATEKPSTPESKSTVMVSQVVKGRLSVQAIPWAYVYLDRSQRRYETPLMNLRLSEGAHQLRIVHQATGHELERMIDIRRDKSVTCIARFDKEKRLQCD